MGTSKIQNILFVIIASFCITSPIKAQYTLTDEFGYFNAYDYGYYNNMNMTWDINTGTDKRLIINYSLGLSTDSYDYINIYEIDQYGNQNYMTTIYGNTTGQYFTTIPSGRARIELITDEWDSWDDGAYWYSGYEISYEVNNADFVPENLNVTYDAYIHGNLEIGTRVQYAGSQLLVKGKIKARNVIMTDSGWADFVFDKNYCLPNLSSVEKYICVNRHLPDMPSAAEVKANGVNVAKMQVKLLQKIEELTLYLIQQEKDISRIKKE